MKKVTGYVSVRPLGQYDFEFYVDDSITDENIESAIAAEIEYSCHYTVEEGYEPVQQTVYRKVR